MRENTGATSMTKNAQKQDLVSEVINLCSKRGIIFPSAEIYGSLAGSYCYGPIGELIRQNLIALWRQKFVHSEENIHQIYGATILPESVFKASGHLATFNDPVIQCKNTGCNSNFRIDHLLQDVTGKSFEGKSLEAMAEVIREKKVTCPRCKGNFGELSEFNLMFKTSYGAKSDNLAYLRPETAQNIFLNFRRIAHAMRAQLPFGVAQIGKAYRNEISPRNFLIRMREFEQMELEMFVDPDKLNEHPRWEEVYDTEVMILTRDAQEAGKGATKFKLEDAVQQGIIHNQYLAYYISLENDFMKELGVNEEQFWFRHLKDTEVAHYSKANYDLEILFPAGTIIECVGNAYRTDYDLKTHAKHSNTKNIHIVSKDGKKVVPHVIEPSFGLDRLFYAILLSAIRKGDREWIWLKLPNSLAPYETQVSPLFRKDGLKEFANNLFWELKDDGLDVLYDESGTIGKRYARADEIGIPFTVTIDYESLENEDVTLRDRDTTEQVRVKRTELAETIRELIFGVISWTDLSERAE